MEASKRTETGKLIERIRLPVQIRHLQRPQLQLVSPHLRSSWLISLPFFPYATSFWIVMYVHFAKLYYRVSRKRTRTAQFVLHSIYSRRSILLAKYSVYDLA